ncbi:MAG: alpha/beta fold hydrolase [Actinomycetota bacterium]|nr:alpha/beta fold hydrolase [Actinomycetota bacterium]
MALAAAAVALTSYGAAGWYFSGELYKMGLSAAWQRAQKPNYDVMVQSVSRGVLVVSSRSPKSPIFSKGQWGISWPGGWARLTKLHKVRGNQAEWSYSMLSGSLERGARVATTVDVFGPTPAALGLPYSSVDFSGPLGRYPAWIVPATSSAARATWAITVNGKSLSRLDCMKIVPVLHDQGMTVMMATYRNDIGAPSSPNGQIGYGSTEWPDLQAAVRYALSHGAKRVVLVGYSMGGGIVMSFLQHSAIADRVSLAVLDSPVLDFSATVDFGARHQRLPLLGVPIPQFLTDGAKWEASLRYGLDWSRMNYLKGKRPPVPILLFQGAADQTVPPATSAELARLHPRQVTYVVTPRAGHLESWNLDPSRYDRLVAQFAKNHLD